MRERTLLHYNIVYLFENKGLQIRTSTRGQKGGIARAAGSDGVKVHFSCGRRPWAVECDIPIEKKKKKKL